MSLADRLILAGLKRRLRQLEAQIDLARFDASLSLRLDKLQTIVDGFEAMLTDEGAQP